MPFITCSDNWLSLKLNTLQVPYNYALSGTQVDTAGVFQRSNISLLLYILFESDLTSPLANEMTTQYTNDTAFLFHSTSPCLIDRLPQNHHDDVRDGVAINADKSAARRPLFLSPN